MKVWDWYNKIKKSMYEDAFFLSLNQELKKKKSEESQWHDPLQHKTKKKKNPVLTKVQQKTAAYTVQLSLSHTHYIAKSFYSSAFTHTYELEWHSMFSYNSFNFSGRLSTRFRSVLPEVHLWGQTPMLGCSNSSQRCSVRLRCRTLCRPVQFFHTKLPCPCL